MALLVSPTPRTNWWTAECALWKGQKEPGVTEERSFDLFATVWKSVLVAIEGVFFKANIVTFKQTGYDFQFREGIWLPEKKNDQKNIEVYES